MKEEDWHNAYSKTMGVFLHGKHLRFPGPKGEHITDDSFYVIFNAHNESINYKLPQPQCGKEWKKILDTDQPVITGE